LSLFAEAEEVGEAEEEVAGAAAVGEEEVLIQIDM